MLHRIVLSVLALTATATGAYAQDAHHVRVSAQVVVVDREAATRAGVSYVSLADGRVVVTQGASRRRGASAGAPLGFRAFLELARERRWARHESTQMVLVLSGAEARVAGLDERSSTFASRASGPSLTVIPTVLGDGTVHLRVRSGVEDRLESPWGSRDASTAWVETELVGRSGEEIVVASSALEQATGRGGILRLDRADRTRDVLIVLTPVLVP
jgi:hypothetical protein